jgi:hypothetical protein
MTFAISSDGASGVATHGDLMRLDEARLAVLVEYTERATLRLEDHTNRLLTAQNGEADAVVTKRSLNAL